MPEPHEYIIRCTVEQNGINTYQSMEHLVWLSLHEATTKNASNFDVKSGFFNAGLYCIFVIFTMCSWSLTTEEKQIHLLKQSVQCLFM